MRSVVLGTERTFITTAPPQTRAEALSRRAMAMIGIATLVAVGIISVAGFGAPGHSGPLAWTGDVQVFTHPTIRGDRVLTGTLRNDGTRPLRVDIGDVRLLAGDGTTVPSAPVFLETFGKSLWAGGRGPQPVPDSELQRTGRIALLEPGERVPLTIAWHEKDGTPEHVDYGEGSLSMPG